VHALAFGQYNKSFKPAKTPFDWLSRDETQVALYINDPLCGFPCSVGFYRDLFKGLRAIHKSQSIDAIPKSLPIFVFGGSVDPVGNMSLSPTALIEAYKKHGIQDLEFIVYPEGRHEMLNELNREEVIENLYNWLQARIQ
jgi:alpha-beta hydrolase superfamily lysophospholipase